MCRCSALACGRWEPLWRRWLLGSRDLRATAVGGGALEAAEDPQALANGYIQSAQTAAGLPFRLVAVPVQYDGEAAGTSRAPEFNEHGDTILESLGFDWDTIIDLKVRNVVV